MLCALAQAVPVSESTAFSVPNLNRFLSHKKAGTIGHGSTSKVFLYHRIPESPAQAKCLELFDSICSAFVTKDTYSYSIPATVAVKKFSKDYKEAYKRESLIYSALGNGSPFLSKAYGFLDLSNFKYLVLEWANAEDNDLFNFIHENIDYKPEMSQIRYIAANLVLGID